MLLGRWEGYLEWFRNPCEKRNSFSARVSQNASDAWSEGFMFRAVQNRHHRECGVKRIEKLAEMQRNAEVLVLKRPLLSPLLSTYSWRQFQFWCPVRFFVSPSNLKFFFVYHFYPSFGALLWGFHPELSLKLPFKGGLSLCT